MLVTYFLLVISLILVGRGLNYIAIHSNSGKMPVWYFITTDLEKEDDGHSVLTKNTKVKFLCDVVPIPTVSGNVAMTSIGDIVQCFGILVLFVSLLKDISRLRRL